MDKIERRRVNNGVEEKLCSHCKTWIPLMVEGKPTFSTRKQSDDGLAYSCKVCEADISKSSYEKRKVTKGHRVRRQKRYMESRDQSLAKARLRYLENREAILDRNRLYRQQHPEVVRIAGAKRRELLRMAESDGSTRADIIKRDSIVLDGKLTPICQICFKPITEITELEVDHKIPLAQGGPDTARNKRTVHSKCNKERPKDGRDLTDEEIDIIMSELEIGDESDES